MKVKPQIAEDARGLWTQVASRLEGQPAQDEVRRILSDHVEQLRKDIEEERAAIQSLSGPLTSEMLKTMI